MLQGTHPTSESDPRDMQCLQRTWSMVRSLNSRSADAVIMPAAGARIRDERLAGHKHLRRATAVHARDGALQVSLPVSGITSPPATRGL